MDLLQTSELDLLELFSNGLLNFVVGEVDLYVCESADFVAEEMLSLAEVTLLPLTPLLSHLRPFLKSVPFFDLQGVLLL